MTSMQRHIDVILTSCAHKILINQCKIITFLILKSDIIENSRNSIQHLQMKLMLHLLLFYPSIWYICEFFLFHIEIEGNSGSVIAGGGGKGMLTLLSNYWGTWPPCPLPPPLSSHAYLLKISRNSDKTEAKCWDTWFSIDRRTYGLHFRKSAKLRRETIYVMKTSELLDT